MPRMNQCWFAGRVVAVKRKYGLSVDVREARALEGVLSECASTEMVVEGPATVAEPTPSAEAPSTGDALSRWDTNGNGRITWRHGSTASRRCTGHIRRTGSCGTGWSANEQDADAGQEEHHL